jgi:flagellum-specific peptidoglycan hydrolase FlgJ
VRKPVAHAQANPGSGQRAVNPYEEAREGRKSSGNAEVYSKAEILQATTRVKVTTAMVLDYIGQYKDIAQNNMRQYGIPASIILGQGILESGAGTGPLSMLANNHFGIKCHNDWTGPSINYDDDEAQECFRKYDQPSESYKDHALFLTTRDRYAFLFDLDKRDYQGWARGLKAAGYATDPKYPDKLIGIIERYQLGKYDAEVLGDEFVPLNTAPLVQREEVSAAADTYQVMAGDTLYSISKRFNLTVDELRTKNNLTDNAISIGQNLKIK